MTDLSRQRWSLYSNLRGALLFGEDEQRVRIGTETGNPATTTLERDDLIAFGELEFGTEYSHWFGEIRTFAQVGLIGQLWEGAGNATNTDFVPARRTEFNIDHQSNLGLLGLRLTGGLTY